MQTEFIRSGKFPQSKMHGGRGVIRLKFGCGLYTMGSDNLSSDNCGALGLD